MSSWKNPLPGVPLIESPFFEEWLEQAGLDPETRRIAVDLRRDGYAVFDFPDASFDRLVDEVRTDVGAMIGGRLAADPKSGMRPVVFDVEFGHRIQDAWAQSAAVRSIATNARILELLRLLFGRRGWPFPSAAYRNASCAASGWPSRMSTTTTVR